MSEPVCDKCGAYIRFAGPHAEAEIDNLKAEVERLRTQRDNLAMMLRRALALVKKMDLDESSPEKHRKFTDQAYILLGKYGYFSPLLGVELRQEAHNE